MTNNSSHTSTDADLIDEVAWVIRDAVGDGVDADTSFRFFEALATVLVGIVLASRHTTRSTETAQETPQAR